jgi:hypothetical protein
MYHTWGKLKYIQSFGKKPEGKRSLGRPSRRWNGNIKAILKKQIQLPQSRDKRRVVQNTIVMLVPLTAENLLARCRTISFSRRTPVYGVS